MEITRLTSKVTELDALVIVLREQLDKASDTEHHAVKKVMSQLEGAEIENRRYKERLSDLAMKEEELSLKVRSLEKEIFSYQEMVYKKDKAIKEEQLNQEKYKESIECIRKNYENQLAVLHDTYRKELAQKEQVVAQNTEEMNRLQQEVSERVPKIVQAALEKAEVQWQTHNQQQMVDMKHDYEAQITKLKTETHNIQTYYTEKEAKQKLDITDERVELDRLRQSQRLLQRDREDLEDECSKLKKQNRQYEHQVQSLELSVQDLQGKLQQVINRQGGNYSLVPMMNNTAVANNTPKGLFNSLLQQSMEKNPPPAPHAPNLSSSHPMSTSMMDMSVNQSLYAQDVSNMINQDALAYLNHQLAQMKVQVQESLQPQSAGSYRKGVSFTPESLYPTPAYSRPPPRAVQELMKEELDTIPTKTGEGRGERDEGHDQTALWQRVGVSHNSTVILDRDTSLLSQIPDYEAKETDRSGLAYLPRPNNRAAAAVAARFRYEAGHGQNSMNNSYLDMESFLDPVSSVNTSHVYESSSLQIIPDGGYYEGYWKAKYSRSK
ncbi:hypothetical protein EON65_12260 [archaeon]|nr:MAG: hypothetical protein EON65_12260 [archaeon]